MIRTLDASSGNTVQGGGRWFMGGITGLCGNPSHAFIDNRVKSENRTRQKVPESLESENRT